MGRFCITPMERGAQFHVRRQNSLRGLPPDCMSRAFGSKVRFQRSSSSGCRREASLWVSNQHVTHGTNRKRGHLSLDPPEGVKQKDKKGARTKTTSQLCRISMLLVPSPPSVQNREVAAGDNPRAATPHCVYLVSYLFVLTCVYIVLCYLCG